MTTVEKVTRWLDIAEDTEVVRPQNNVFVLSIDFCCVVVVAASDVCEFGRQIKLYYYDTVVERYIESRLEVHRTKTLAEATEIAWKVFAMQFCAIWKYLYTYLCLEQILHSILLHEYCLYSLC